MSTITQIVDPYTKVPTINSPSTFNSDVDVFLNEINSRVTQTNTQSSQMNTVAGEVNVNAQQVAENTTSVEGWKNETLIARDEAVAVVATIPDGTINDTITTSVDTWSSQKISDELDLKIDVADIVDDLTNTDINKPLSANQGRVLKDSKQDNLESGVNIKTINNQSILGSGNITISVGTTAKETHTLVDEGLNLTATNSTILDIESNTTSIITLPDATTLGNGKVYSIKNLNTFLPMYLYDNSNGYIGILKPDSTTEVLLRNNATASGEWKIKLKTGIGLQPITNVTGATTFSEEYALFSLRKGVNIVVTRGTDDTVNMTVARPLNGVIECSTPYVLDNCYNAGSSYNIFSFTKVSETRFFLSYLSSTTSILIIKVIDVLEDGSVSIADNTITGVTAGYTTNKIILRENGTEGIILGGISTNALLYVYITISGTAITTSSTPASVSVASTAFLEGIYKSELIYDDILLCAGVYEAGTYDKAGLRTFTLDWVNHTVTLNSTLNTTYIYMSTSAVLFATGLFVKDNEVTLIGGTHTTAGVVSNLTYERYSINANGTFNTLITPSLNIDLDQQLGLTPIASNDYGDSIIFVENKEKSLVYILVGNTANVNNALTVGVFDLKTGTLKSNSKKVVQNISLQNNKTFINNSNNQYYNSCFVPFDYFSLFETQGDTIQFPNKHFSQTDPYILNLTIEE